MKHYAGMDLSMETTQVCIVDESGRKITSIKVESAPDMIAHVLTEIGGVECAVIETGRMSLAICHGLRALGIPVVCISLQGFRQGSVTARRYGLSRSLLTRWRLEYRSGLLSVSASVGFSPLTVTPLSAPQEMTAPLRSEDDKTIEIGLPNGRRLTIPASLDPTILARLLPVLDAP